MDFSNEAQIVPKKVMQDHPLIKKSQCSIVLELKF